MNAEKCMSINVDGDGYERVEERNIISTVVDTRFNETTLKPPPPHLPPPTPPSPPTPSHFLSYPVFFRMHAHTHSFMRTYTPVYRHHYQPSPLNRPCGNPDLLDPFPNSPRPSGYLPGATR